MREMLGHGPGRFFLAVVITAILLFLFAVPRLAFSKTLFFGFMPAVWFWQALILVVCGGVCFWYLYREWPYRNM